MQIKDRTIALLIDSDNVSREYYAVLLDELVQYGRVTYRRLYGDFSRPKKNGWEAALLEHSIELRQVSHYTKGKNATDSVMMIDAMDILYGGFADCFCLATSDSDFTSLAVRFRNHNLIVIGAGEKKTPHAFRRACDRFIAVDELLVTSAIAKPTSRPTSKATGHKATNPAPPERTPILDTPTLDTSVPQLTPGDLPISLTPKRRHSAGKRAKQPARKALPSLEPLIQDALLHESGALTLDSPLTLGTATTLDATQEPYSDTPTTPSSDQRRAAVIDLAYAIIDTRANADGWVHFSVLIDEIYRKINDFNPKLYGQTNSHVATFFTTLDDGTRAFVLEKENNIVRIKKSTTQ